MSRNDRHFDISLVIDTISIY